MLNDAAVVIGSNAIAAAITHAQLHSADAGPAWTTLAVGARIAVTESVDADGDITFTVTAPDGHLSANQAVDGVSYWSAPSGGTNYGGVGGANFTGDATANSAGAYVVSVTENTTAS